MNLHRPAFLLGPVLVLALSGCGFHLRAEANLPPSMKRLHIQGTDPLSPLARDLAKVIKRSGTEIVDKVEPGVAVLNISANSRATEVLSVGATALAKEYAMRYHVEFEVQDAAGTPLLPKQTIELSRDFTYDQSQVLGIAAEEDLLTQELEQDMVQTIVRRLEAVGRMTAPAK